MTRLHSSRTTASIRLVCFLVCYSLVTTLPAFTLRGVAIASSSAPSEPFVRTKKTPIKTQQTPQRAVWRDGQLLVRFREHAPVTKLNALLGTNGAQWNGQLRGQSQIERLSLPAGLDPEMVAATLRASQWVDFAEPNYLINADQSATQSVPNDPRFSEQTALKSTISAQAWGITTGSKQTVIAILDSGIDFTHPDLKANEWNNTLEQDNNLDNDQNGFTSDLHGWDFVSDSSTIIDEQGHGTAVAGVIAAQGNNSTGISGVMWNAGLMSLRVLDNTGTGDVAHAIEAIDYAVANGAQIINCSWGTDDSSTALREAINRAAERGVIVITSAGNSSRDIETTPRFPASFDLPNLIAVASIDDRDQLSSFSNWGMAHASIAAPGTEILTTKMGGDYQTVSGTSLSAAFVTGVAGLIKSLRPWLGAERTRELILRGARQVPALSDKIATKDVVSSEGALGILNTLPANEGLDETSGNNGGEHGNNGNGRSNQRAKQRGNRPGKDNDNSKYRDGHEFSVTPPARTQGAPGSGLPNLNELRSLQPTSPQAAPPIPSTRCSHRHPQCDKDKQKAAIESSTDLLAWGLSLPPLETIFSDHSLPVSDTPFKLGLIPQPLSAALSPQPQTTRTNVALASNGSVATASSAYSTSYPASAAINGDRKGTPPSSGGLWHSASPGNTFPDWLQVDFNGNKTIDEIDLFTIQDNYTSPVEPTTTMTFSLYGLTGFKVQYWNSSTWVDVTAGNVTGNNKVWRSFSFTPITTSKIRVQTTASVDGYSRITELEAYGTDAVRTNVAISTAGAVASASSYYTPGPYTANKANNGDRRGTGGEMWHTPSPGNTFPDWLQIDFNGSKTIDEIDVFTIQDNYSSPSEPTEAMTFSLYGLTGYDVQYWNGSAWVNVPGGSVTGNNLVWRRLTFSALTTAKIRVLTHSSVDGYSRITEVEAYETTGSATTSDYSTPRLEATNRTGDSGVDLLSGNANWSIPILGLKGRAGLDFGLALSYNSLVWTKAASSNSIKFDADRGTPSPGFRLGFPVIQPPFYNSQIGTNAYLLITPSGEHIELRRVGTSNTYESANSSYLQLIDNGGSLTLRPTDGSQLSYALYNGQYLCTQAKDRNGNYITVSYNTDGRINTITDALARVITFNYDTYQNLISITQDWGSGVTHTWANLGWNNLTIQTSYSGQVGPQNGTVIPVLSQVNLSDGTRYSFDYNSYAQVTVVHHYAADNHQLSYISYTHTLPAGGNDCPRVTESHEWAENWNNNQEATTTYTLAPDHSSGQVTMPDTTTSYKELFATTGWQKGLTTGAEYWSAGVKKKWTTTAYTQDDTGLPFQKNPRVVENNIYDPEGNHRRMTIDYGSGSGPGSGQYAQYGLPYIVTEYAANGTTPIRSTFTDYNLDPVYVNQRIIGLVSAVHVSDSAWQSKTTYSYDAGGDQLQATTSAATQHDAVYGTGFTARGNVTSISRYNVEGNNISNDSLALTTRIGYNTNGSIIFTRDPLNHQSNISYADSFSDGGHPSTYAYPTKATPPTATGETAESFASTTQYNYYFGAVTRSQGPAPAGQTQGAIQTLEYDSAGRISKLRNENNGAYRRWVYAPTGAIMMYAFIQSGAPEAYSVMVFDGMGRIMATGEDNPGSQGLFSGQYTAYDVRGRISKKSNPTEMTEGWVAAGDDSPANGGAGWSWTLQAYDWKDRPTITTNPDGTTKEASYGGCGCAGGETVTLRDEMGRSQRITSDVLGRTWKTEVLNWDQDHTVYSTTTNTYNARDQVASTVEQGASGLSQTTTFAYDGYGRLKQQQAPSQTNPTQYIYNLDDTVYKVTDARGVETTFTYNDRHLITGINYNSPPGIAQTLSVFLSYDAAGNRTSLTDGSGSLSSSYDQLSRLTSETKQFTGLSGSYSLSYSYNLSGELKSITDPTNATINYGYDQTGRMTGVTGSTFAGVTSYATNLQYRAWGMLKSASFGDNSSLSASYNSRLLPTDFSIANILTKHYEYNADGRLRYSRNNAGDRFDRSYTYDQVGRVIEATSGPKARGQADTDIRPYDLYYEYDQMNHLTSRGGRLWSGQAPSEAGSYANDRNIYWQYDADGRLTNSGETQYSYDAAGRATSITGEEGDLTQTQAFDGFGTRVMLSSQQVTHHENGTTTTESKTQYFVTSSVIGGVVTELDQSGQKTRTFVYQGGEILAWQEKNGSTETMTWEHRDLSNASVKAGMAAELEPLGMNAGAINPFPLPSTRPPLEAARTYPGFADMMLGSQCRVDGIDTPCSIVSSDANIQCPNNNCGPRAVRNSSGDAIGIAIFGTNPSTGQTGYWAHGATSVVVHVEGYPDTPGRPNLWTEFVPVNTATNSFLAHASNLGVSQQNPRTVAKFDLERFKKCLQTNLRTTMGLSDGRSQGFDINTGSFSGFFDSDIPFSARVDTTSKSGAELTQIARQSGRLSAKQTAIGMFDPSHPEVAYIANDKFENAAPVSRIATEVHELSNKIYDKFSVYGLAQPHASLRLRNRLHSLHADDDDAGIAMEECTFGGYVQTDGTVIK